VTVASAVLFVSSVVLTSTCILDTTPNRRLALPDVVSCKFNKRQFGCSLHVQHCSEYTAMQHDIHDSRICTSCRLAYTLRWHG
jgi:hypothetical protein